MRIPPTAVAKSSPLSHPAHASSSNPCTAKLRFSSTYWWNRPIRPRFLSPEGGFCSLSSSSKARGPGGRPGCQRHFPTQPSGTPGLPPALPGPRGTTGCRGRETEKAQANEERQELRSGWMPPPLPRSIIFTKFPFSFRLALKSLSVVKGSGWWDDRFSIV